ncbi:excisionase family DNA-binding protein [Streptomyces sp. NPDC056191]|uniref:excisionase family DNA-binding protein n=1 Tax=Streptomyces sp. NPDC056191 TaxID=3345742 RepID=UPI0035E08A17
METTESTESAVAEVFTPPSTPYVTVRWIAGYLAVGLSTIYDAVEAGDLPAIRVGRGTSKAGIRVLLSDVRAYEKSRQIKPKVAANAA